MQFAGTGEGGFEDGEHAVTGGIFTAAAVVVVASRIGGIVVVVCHHDTALHAVACGMR